MHIQPANTLIDCFHHYSSHLDHLSGSLAGTRRCKEFSSACFRRLPELLFRALSPGSGANSSTSSSSQSSSALSPPEAGHNILSFASLFQGDAQRHVQLLGKCPTSCQLVVASGSRLLGEPRQAGSLSDIARRDFHCFRASRCDMSNSSEKDREWGVGNGELFAIPHSLLPILHSRCAYCGAFFICTAPLAL